MFATVKKHFNDAKTLSALCAAAEGAARKAGASKPGSEHFVLGALELADNTGLATFTRLGITREAFAQAIRDQFTNALGSVGISVPEGLVSHPAAASRPKPTLYEAEPSGQRLVQRLAEARGSRAGRPLVGADVLLAVTHEEFTVATRAFRVLGVGAESLAAAAKQSII
jgi:hypothetical protein